MKRLFVLGGIMMLLLCITVPAQATVLNLSIDFEDLPDGDVFGMDYVNTHYVSNMLGMMGDEVPGSQGCLDYPELCEQFLTTLPMASLSSGLPYGVATPDSSDLLCGVIGGKPPTWIGDSLPPWIPTDKAAGLILMFFAPLESFSVDFAPSQDAEYAWVWVPRQGGVPGYWDYAYQEAHDSAATKMDIKTYASLEMTGDEEPPRLYEGELSSLPAVGTWQTLSLTGSQIEGAQVVMLMAPAATEDGWVAMAFDNIEYTLACYPPDVEGDSDVDGADLAEFAALYNNNPGGDDNRDLGDLACFANEFGLPNMAEIMGGFGGA